MSIAWSQRARSVIPPEVRERVLGFVLGCLLLGGCSSSDDGTLYAVRAWQVDLLTEAPCGRPDMPNVGAAPWGLAVGTSGEVYLSETFAGRWRAFSSTGTELGSYGTCGAGDGQFDWPKYLDVHPDGWVFVVDSRNARVQKWSTGGQFVLAWGQMGTGPGEGEPTAVAVDAARNEVYTLDAGNSRVQVFDLDGVFLRAFGEPGSGPGQFDFFDPAQGAEGGVDVGPDGNVYVVDHVNHRVQVFTPTGAFVRLFDGDGTSTLNRPSGIAVTSDGRVFVVDETKLWGFTTAGAPLGSWILGGVRGAESGCIGPLGGLDVVALSDGTVAVTQGRCINFYQPPVSSIP